MHNVEGLQHREIVPENGWFQGNCNEQYHRHPPYFRKDFQMMLAAANVGHVLSSHHAPSKKQIKTIKWAPAWENQQCRFWPSLTQTRLHSYWWWLEAWNFGFRKSEVLCYPRSEKTKELIIFAVTLKLISVCFRICKMLIFSYHGSNFIIAYLFWQCVFLLLWYFFIHLISNTVI